MRVALGTVLFFISTLYFSVSSFALEIKESPSSKPDSPLIMTEISIDKSRQLKYLQIYNNSNNLIDLSEYLLMTAGLVCCFNRNVRCNKNMLKKIFKILFFTSPLLLLQDNAQSQTSVITLYWLVPRLKKVLLKSSVVSQGMRL